MDTAMLVDAIQAMFGDDDEIGTVQVDHCTVEVTSSDGVFVITVEPANYRCATCNERIWKFGTSWRHEGAADGGTVASCADERGDDPIVPTWMRPPRTTRI